MRQQGTGLASCHPLSYAEAKKMMSLALYSCGYLMDYFDKSPLVVCACCSSTPVLSMALWFSVPGCRALNNHLGEIIICHGIHLLLAVEAYILCNLRQFIKVIKVDPALEVMSTKEMKRNLI